MDGSCYRYQKVYLSFKYRMQYFKYFTAVQDVSRDYVYIYEFLDLGVFEKPTVFVSGVGLVFYNTRRN
ncbi:hypothetical protein L917_14083 [Phytophthora nicotianae]|uniref:Uncharacterized protein n=1 Tax=Phytophthora nicotianae TaxID=4792 RepID=W2M2V8_PHYNI|nr:hypothetical protein L915_14354 [Phytophthora nicotianae]ETL33234.1 hypothetical protein L916_14257 [Phytophthora nicotianae]ETL86486.1 hypothetical protein L917_14083 [Phytophthora nicotianae]ETM30716.1 hypothetical protein L914_21608 [Phytophthora nicotianae]